MFISRGKEDALVTKNMVVGESVYGEKRINVEVRRSIFCIYMYMYVYIYGILTYIRMLKTCILNVKEMYSDFE